MKKADTVAFVSAHSSSLEPHLASKDVLFRSLGANSSSDEPNDFSLPLIFLCIGVCIGF